MNYWRAASRLNSELAALPPASVDFPLAWRMAAVAFAVGFIVFGVVYSFGVFLEPIMADLGSNRSATSALYYCQLRVLLPGPGDRIGRGQAWPARHRGLRSTRYGRWSRGHRVRHRHRHRLPDIRSRRRYRCRLRLHPNLRCRRQLVRKVAHARLEHRSNRHWSRHAGATASLCGDHRALRVESGSPGASRDLRSRPRR
jgi:hypothetical protein